MTAGLEHKKVLCELSPEERSCARCGTEMIKIGEKFARTELVIVPAQVYAVDYHVASYKCAHCEKETGLSQILCKHRNAVQIEQNLFKAEVAQAAAALFSK